MSMTLKQKQNMIPVIKQEIRELKNDLLIVQSGISIRLIQQEIEEMETTINEYQEHLAGLTSPRSSYGLSS